MYKKSILSLAIASSFALTGCLDNSNVSDKNATDTEALTEAVQDVTPNTYPVFDPAASELPIPNDLIFDSTAGDGTFAVTPDPTNPAVTALQSLSGASTVAPIDLEISGLIDETTLTGNVFLIALDYASGSALQGLQISEPPTVLPSNQPSYDVSAVTLDGTSYIRINPTSPLDPLTRYVVVITNGVLDAAGLPLERSPGVTGYGALSDTNVGVADPALQPVKDLINDLWEPIALQAVPTLSESNIVLSYGFTTSGDEKVLNYIADPAQWFNDQLDTFLGVSAATSVVQNQTDVDSDGDVDYTDVSLAKAGALATFPSTDIQAALPTLFGTGAPCNGTTGSTAIGCISNSLVAAPVSLGGFADLLPTPAAATVTFDETTTQDIYQSSSLVASLMEGASVPVDTVRVTQGSITIPYYLGQPSGPNGAPLITDHWEADDTLATAINTAFSPLGLSIPQADPAVSSVVNYIFPFPKSTGDVTIPILAIHPASPSGADMKTVMYQHGITTDRSTALTFGGSMVAAGLGVGSEIAVIAIDQPLHGIDGFSTDNKKALAEQLLASAGTLTTIDGTFDGVDSDEQATIDAVFAGVFSTGIVQGVDTATNSGAPGATACVDLGTNGLAATTASILGGACDADPIVDAAIGQDASSAVFSAQILESTIANGASQIPGLEKVAGTTERHFEFTASATTGAAPVAMDPDGDASANSSGSMFINLTNFLGTRDNVRQLVVDLLAVRKSVGSMDVNGAAANGNLDADDVYFIGHSLGTINGMPFVAVANDSATTTDDIVAANFLTPGGGLTRLLENSPAFGPAVIGGLAGLGLTQDTSSFQAFFNIFQAAVDSGDPINFVQDFEDTTPVLFSEVIGDTTIPNSLDEASEVLGDGSITFLSGTEPLAVESGAATISATSALEQNIIRYTEGTHGTPAFPSTQTAEEIAAYAELVGQATSIVVSGGTGVTVTNTSVIQ